MARWMLAAIVLGLVVLCAAPGTAQTMFLQMPAPCLGTVCSDRRIDIGLEPLAIRGERRVAQDGAPSYVTPDGRFGVGLRRAATESAAFVVTDLVNGGSFDVAVPGASGFLGHPRRAEVYATDAGGVFALSAAGVRRLAAMSCGTFGPTVRAITTDGSRVAVHCGIPGSALVVDTTTGAVIATLPSMRAFAADGVHAYDISGNPSMLRRIVVVTGTEVGQIAISPTALSAGVIVEPRTGRVILSEGKYQPVRVFEADLTFRQFAPYAPLAWWSFDPHRPRGVAYTSELVEGGWGVGGVVLTNLAIVDTDQWSIMQSAGSTVLPLFAVPAVAWPPGAPSGLTATVAGASVALSWSTAAPAAAVRYLLEAGTAPGLANIATFDVGLQTGLAVGAVPSGTYYVRVRAENFVGSSLPSNEVVVVVP